MIHDVPAPEISEKFTIDDIHKIREWHYEVLKDATKEEQKEFYRREAAPLLAELEVAKARRQEKVV
jgi:hypothetical protein